MQKKKMKTTGNFSEVEVEVEVKVKVEEKKMRRG
jgi:hypothetical protein